MTLDYPPRSVCLFCGHKDGNDPAYRAEALSLGQDLAKRGWTLIYGGGGQGLMGAAADGALDADGHVVGVIPQFLMELEAAHGRASEMVVCNHFDERKKIMFERSDAVVVLPGGFGTADELFEIITQRQLERLSHPIILVNVKGYFDPWIAMIEKCVSEGFAFEDNLSLFQTAPNAASALDLLERS